MKYLIVVLRVLGAALVLFQVIVILSNPGRIITVLESWLEITNMTRLQQSFGATIGFFLPIALGVLSYFIAQKVENRTTSRINDAT